MPASGFSEAHDLIVKAWTSDGPFAWEGEHYRFRYINLWPKPYQQPHPPIWIPGSGSPETMDWVAKQRYTYMVLPTLAPFELRRQSAEYFRECCEHEGYTARHEQIGWGIGIYVAETDAQAGGSTSRTSGTMPATSKNPGSSESATWAYVPRHHAHHGGAPLAVASRAQK